MNTENAPKVTQQIVKSVAMPNPEIVRLSEFPLPLLAGEVFDPPELEVEVGFGVATVPVYVTPLAVAAT